MDIQNQADQQNQPPVVSQPSPINVGVSKKAMAGLILGIIGIFAWLIPIIGAPITIVGLVFGIKGLKTAKKKTAIWAVVLCIIGLVLTIINGSIGSYMGATGQHPFVNKILNKDNADYQDSFKETFKTNYLSGCVGDKSNMSEFCSCTYNNLLEKLGLDGFMQQSLDYIKTHKMSSEFLEGISVCINLIPKEQ